LRKTAIEILLWAVFIAAAGTGIMLFRSRTAYEKAVSAMAQDQRKLAVSRLEESVRWYFPGNPYTRSGLNRLRFIAREDELAGETDSALRNYRAVSRAIMSIRHLWMPYGSLYEYAENAKNRLMSDIPGSPDQAELRSLSGTGTSGTSMEDPSTVGVLFIIMGIAAWMAGTGMLALKGMDKQGRFNSRARYYVLFSVGGALSWMLASVYA